MSQLFLSETVGLSLERLCEVKKRKKRKEKGLLKFNIHKKARVVTKISSCCVSKVWKYPGATFIAAGGKWQPCFTIVLLKKLYIVGYSLACPQIGRAYLSLTAQLKNRGCTFKITTVTFPWHVKIILIKHPTLPWSITNKLEVFWLCVIMQLLTRERYFQHKKIIFVSPSVHVMFIL